MKHIRTHTCMQSTLSPVLGAIKAYTVSKVISLSLLALGMSNCVCVWLFDCLLDIAMTTLQQSHTFHFMLCSCISRITNMFAYILTYTHTQTHRGRNSSFFVFVSPFFFLSYLMSKVHQHEVKFFCIITYLRTFFIGRACKLKSVFLRTSNLKHKHAIIYFYLNFSYFFFHRFFL